MDPRDDAHAFEAHRPALLLQAYRMLGDLGRAEDMVQEAWLRWQSRAGDVDTPRAFLLTTVTRLCLDELGSAHARHEESRSDRLPEPVAFEDAGLARVEMLDRVSMAFLVVLQRLTPAERAVLLLHDVFEMSHAEIAGLIGKNDAACRQLLRRARESVGTEKRVFTAAPEEHRALLSAFVQAITSADDEAITKLLAEDAVFIADGGPDGVRYGRLRNVGKPVVGRVRIASVLKAFARQDVEPPTIEERTLNGEPAIVAFRHGQPIAAILVSVADGAIRHVFVQLDPERLRHLGARPGKDRLS